MEELYALLAGRLRNARITEVYPGFDAVPVQKKSAVQFVILSVQEIRFGETRCVQGGTVHPFSAAVRADLHLPMTAQAQAAAAYFYERLVPALLQDECQCRSFAVQPPHGDAKLQKLVFGGEFRFDGVLCVSGEEETS